MPEGGSAPTTKMAIGDGAGLGRNRLQRNKFQLGCNCPGAQDALCETAYHLCGTGRVNSDVLGAVRQRSPCGDLHHQWRKEGAGPPLAARPEEPDLSRQRHARSLETHPRQPMIT